MTDAPDPTFLLISVVKDEDCFKLFMQDINDGGMQ